jgi:N-acyl-D-aspartate/D-glutamate deacylase
LNVIESARTNGIDVTFDIHLETCGTTAMTSILPPWVKTGGLPEMLDQLKDHEVRVRLRKDMLTFTGPGTSGFVRHGRWDLLRIISSTKHKDLIGNTILDIATSEGKDPFDVVFDLLIDEGGDLRIGSSQYYSEDDNRALLMHPLSVIETDASELGPIEGQSPRGGLGFPPRTFGTFPRVLGTYVREEKILSLEEAVRKMTSAPARRMDLKARGIIAENFYADLVIFDPKTVRDNATEDEFLAGERYANPYPDGIKYVVINGKVVLENGSHTGERAGVVLRHS